MLFENQRRRTILFLFTAATISISVLHNLPHADAAEVRTGGSPRIYIQPQDGFESYISAAIVKKHVPAVVTQNKEEAQYFLTSAVIAKEESTGSKVARCLFLYCAGMEGSQTATVQLVNSKTQDVAWAYNVRKGSAKAYQSSAEAIAKHLKQYLEDHPQ